MIEQIVLDYLKNELDVPVHMEEQEHLNEYVVIEKTSGGEEDYIESATIAIKSYGLTLYKAAKLNEQVKAKMKRIAEIDSIGSARLNTDYNFTDITKKRYRYQAVYDLNY